MRCLRRITALVTQLLVIPFVIVSGSVGCPMAGADAPAVVVAHTGALSASSATHAHQHGESNGDSHGGSHCDMPCAPSACASAGHCPPGVAVRTDPPHVSLAARTALRVPLRMDAPASVSTAPEPPPPRIQPPHTLL